MKRLQKPLSVLLAVALTLNLSPAGPRRAMADVPEGPVAGEVASPTDPASLDPTAPDAAAVPAAAPDSAPADPAPRAEGALAPQADGDMEVASWADLQTAVNDIASDHTITLTADVVAGDGDRTIAFVREGATITIDLAGHAINRNLSSLDEDNGGHVLDVNKGTLVVRDTSAEKSGTITGGIDERGGGVVIGSEGTLNLESGSIAGNRGVQGGGVFVYGHMLATGGSVTGNTGGDAGGIYVAGGTIDFTGVSVTSNTATDAGGGGINNKGYTALTGCTVSNNSAALAGGGVYNEGELHLSGTTMSGNATADTGGAVSTRNITYIDDCTLTGNTAAQDGGALYSYGCSTTVTGSTFNENKTEASGGAIRVYGGTVELRRCTLNENEATWYGGGIYGNNGGTLGLLESTSITGNTGYKGGGGVFVAGEMGEVRVGSGLNVTGNLANNIYLTGDRRVTVAESLAPETRIGVALEAIGGSFTYGFASTNTATDPNTVFVAEPGFSCIRDGDGEARVITSDWVELQAKIDAAENGSAIVLDRSWQAVDENVALTIPAEKSITIDLNGYEIDRHRSSYVDGGEVIAVYGELGLVDNSEQKKGAVTGGFGSTGGIRVYEGGKLKLQGGTIRDNHARSAGGGVCVEGSATLEAYGGVICDNISEMDGGGVYTYGTFVGEGCDISRNTAKYSGGGVYSSGSTTLESGSISSNRVIRSGGGIYQQAGTLQVNRGGTPLSVTSNKALENGGGLFSVGGTATFAAGDISGNSAWGNGGGVGLLAGATLHLQDVSVTSNYAAADGGGIFSAGATLGVKGAPRVTGNVGTIGRNILLDQAGVITVEEALTADGESAARLDVLTRDIARPITSGFTATGCAKSCFTTDDHDDSNLQERDGELYVTPGDAAVEVGSWDELQEALDNPPASGSIGLKNDVTADDDDVSLSIDGEKSLTLDLRGYTINRNLTESEGSDGHVIEVDGDSSVTIADTVGTGTITGGYADNGGGLYVHGGSSLELKGVAVIGNSADSDGAGVYSLGTLNADGCSIVRNRADDNGGGIYAESDASLDLSRANVSSNTARNEGGGLDLRCPTARLLQCSVNNNRSSDDDGGGFNVDRSDLLLTLEQTEVNDNYSGGGHRGGGIFLNDGRVDVKGGSLSQNSAETGGAIFNNECAVTISGATLSGNVANEHGGGAITNGGSLQLSDCTVDHNSAPGDGGAIFSNDEDSVTATNCSFANNESTMSSGGALCTDCATTLTNCTFTNNKAHNNGGAICIHGDTTIDGGTISGNTATEYGGGVLTNHEGTLRLLGRTSDLTITGNSCSLQGCGVYIPWDTNYVSVAGKVSITGNDFDDFFMAGDKCLDVVDAIEGSQIGVGLERGTGQFTINLAAHEAGVDPSTLFLAPAGMWAIPTAEGEAQLVASDWPMLQRLIDQTADGGTLVLDRDWKAAPQNVSLKIASGKTITIDLNGHTIDRARTGYEDAGEVFSVYGTLNVTDTSESAAGRICGGYGDGGGAVVFNLAELHLLGGNIAGNRAKTGGGVLVCPGAIFEMTGGTVQQNHADADGGGVCLANAGDEVPVAWLYGGQITGNDASGSGGGVFTAASSRLNVHGSVRVLDNVAPQGANLLLASDVAANVDDALAADARIDLVAQSPGRPLTSNLTASGSADVALQVFTYDKATGRLEVRDDELYLTQSADVVTVSDWQALQNAINDEANRDKVIRLGGDVTATEDDDRLLLDGKSVIVDLGGHALNRNLDESDSDGHVFELVNGSTLTIQDSAGAGRVTGGYAEHGGAVNVHEGCTCNVEGGTFIGNRAEDEGGAFYVYGTLNMSGGMITQNEAESGGAVFVDGNGSTNLTNVVIVSNKATKWGGGAINNKGNATLTNCIVKTNVAGNEGGAIYNGDRQLTLNGCTVTDNSSGGGGGLCCYGTVVVNDTTIANNYANDFGGGLYVRGVVTVNGGSITGNTGKTDGGGIFNQGGLLTVTGATISSNGTEAGGGALNNKGTAELTSCTLAANHAGAEGGAIYAGVDSGTTLADCTIQENSGGLGGGVAAYGTMTVNGSTISKNTADAGGAGVFTSGDTTLAGTTVSENSARESGGGVLVRARSLTIDGASVTKNSTTNLGGGVMVEGGAGAVVVKGAITVGLNDGSGDVYLADGKVLTVGGPLGDDAGSASIGVRAEKGVGVVLTSGYSNDNADKDPATLFSSNDGYEVYLEGSEVSTRKVTVDDESFVEPGSQVNRDVGTLTGVNWMSGLSGERRLNEINVPGTHDSATKSVVANLTTGNIAKYIQLGGDIASTFFGLPATVVINILGASVFSAIAEKFARCQERYIDEQLLDGIRHLDLRLNTYYVEPGWPPGPNEDNGEDLYLCHGKDEDGGTYFAFDRRTSDVEHDDYDFLTFRKTLGWIKTFLEEHPTETLTMVVSIESVDDVYDEGMARIRKHLHDELSTQINPSTGKPYLYMEDGVFGKRLTEYPQLKDCRGQVVLECSDADADILGGVVKENVVTSVQGPDGDHSDNADAKIRNLKRFFADHGYDDLPRTAGEAIDYMYFVGLNGTDEPSATPLEIAKKVLEAMFGEGGLVVDKAGKYIGRINMDGENAEYSKVVWSSNFFAGTEYCKVTVKSGFGDEVSDSTYVLYGTKLPVSECIYANPNSEGKYFQCWEAKYDNIVGGDTWKVFPGQEFIVNGDVTFTATWGEQNTPVRVLWNDADDEDGLRPDSLQVSVAGITDPVSITPAANWRVTLDGGYAPEDVTVTWDKIAGDGEGTYACKVRKREGGPGLEIVLTHTPQEKVQAKGEVHWKDDDDAEGKRPDSVVVHLLADDRVIDSTTATAAGGWTWDLGERPAFVDGKRVTYAVGEDEVEGYLTYARGFEVTNVLNGPRQSTTLSGMVFWADDDNAGKTRPKSVTINLLKDGNKIDSQEVTADKDGIWAMQFEVPGTYWDAVYTVTEEAVEGYTTKVYPPDETGGMLLVSNALESHEHVHKTVSAELVAPTCTTKGLRRTVEYCEGCGEIFSDANEDVAALGHDWGDWQTIRPATETQVGMETRTCSRDRSHTQSRVIPMTGHVHGLTHVEARPATCTEDGNTEYWECTEGENPCGMRFADAAATEWVHEEATVVHATGHEWGSWTVVRAPSETVVGIERRECEHDPLHVQFRIVPKLNHVHGLTHVEARDATCTEDGNIEYWRCTEGEDPCGLCFADEGGTDWVHEEATVVHATGHDWGDWRIVKPATESEKGEMLRICHNDFTHMQTRDIPKVGHIHELVRVAARPATCTEDGNIEYWKCADEGCGMLFRDPAGIEWVHEEAVVVHALGHEWAEPTYEWGTGDATVSARRTCLRDASHAESETVGVDDITYLEPTCTTPGKALKVSQPFENGAFLVQAKDGADMPALGHDWSAWEVTRPATETEDGEESRTCARCGEVETRAIPASISYRYVGDENLTWTRGDTAPLELTFKRSVDDELTFSLFKGIEVDGVAVGEKSLSGDANYTARSGSLVLNLQPAWLSTLSDGEHTVRAIFEDGSATATFTVASRAAAREGGSDSERAMPATGDAALPGTASALCVMGVAALAVALVRRKRRE
ncbi:Cna B-type domain-containing protein [Olsenella intestinalis]|uniref:Cna B-type domain-containing protein n=1 Tax=Olsenella intestinalis TaxID=2930083 RepID=UPI00200BDF2A|nr:Cna B-type domain-containing protein [Olsenella intestinalis]